MRCWRCCASVPEIRLASVDDVRSIQRRRDADELEIRLALESADRQTAWIARESDEVVGVALAHDTDDERYLGDLFVEPSFRSQGLGARLADAAFGGVDLSRSMAVTPRHEASIALALRLGLVPREVILSYAGEIPKEDELARMAAGDYRFEVADIDPDAHRFALDELDRQTRGTSRPSDHLDLLRSSTGSAFFAAGECVAYAYVAPDGRVGPIACSAAAYMVQILAYALVTLRRRHGASWCTLLVPGSNRRIARAALRAGLRIVGSFVLAADAAHGDLATYVGYHQLRL